jgi:hypothetical protein
MNGIPHCFTGYIMARWGKQDQDVPCSTVNCFFRNLKTYYTGNQDFFPKGFALSQGAEPNRDMLVCSQLRGHSATLAKILQL